MRCVLALLCCRSSLDIWYTVQCVCCQSSRLSEYEKTKQKITSLVDQLEVPPGSQFELDVVNGDSSSFIPTAGNMDELQRYYKEVCCLYQC